MNKENLKLLTDLANRLKTIDPRAMSLPELHGYLSAIIISPELIPPSLWMLFVYNEDGEEPENADEVDQDIYSNVVEFYNNIIASMDEDSYELIIGESGMENDEKLGLWGEGFLKGAVMWETEESVDEDEDLSSMLLPIAYFIDAEALAGDMPDKQSKEEFLSAQTREQMRVTVPASVIMIRDYFYDLISGSETPAGRILPFEAELGIGESGEE